MIVVNYSTSFYALDQYIKNYNEQAFELSCRVRQGSAATARDIIVIYGRFLAKASSVEDLNLDDLPGLRTNNVQLAKLANASPRTIQRHINRLQQSGIITRKVWHGSNSSYELWLNPDILLARRRKTVEEAELSLKLAIERYMENERTEQLSEELSTNCPHTDSGNNSYTNNILNAVDNPEDDRGREKKSGYRTGNAEKRCSLALTGEIDESGNEISGHTGEKVAKKIKNAGEKMRTRAADPPDGEVTSPDEDPARSASLSLYVNLLWSLSKTVLYSDTYLAPRQEEIAKALIRKWYEPVRTNKLAGIHQIYIERITLVRKFIEKDPLRRYVQLPYKYFDPENPNGFAGTKKWWKEHEKRKKEVQAKLILHAQIRRFVRNEMKDPARRRPPLELYRECETRIGKLRDPLLLRQFHAAVLNPEINQQIYTYS